MVVKPIILKHEKYNTYITLFPAFAVSLSVLGISLLVGVIIEHNAWIGVTLLSFVQWWVDVMESVLASV